MPVVGVWGLAYHSFNITDLNLKAGSTFQITVNVTNLPSSGINTYQFDLVYNVAFLIATKAIVDASTIFGTDAQVFSNSTSPPGDVNVVVADFAGGSTLSSGVLARITFQVIDKGYSLLELRNSQLLLGNPIDSTTQNGIFDNSGFRPPIVAFSYTWVDTNNDGKITAGETVIFNASKTRDPNGAAITQYSWDFSDTSGVINAPNPVVQHVFTVGGSFGAGSFPVRLTVQDALRITNSTSQVVRVFRVLFHDVGILAVNAAPNSALPGVKVEIDYTVRNNGTFTETFNVTVSQGARVLKFDPLTMEGGANQARTAIWDTTGMAPGTYEVKVVASRVGNATDPETNLKNNQLVTFVRIEAPGEAFISPLLIGSAIGVLAVLGAVVYLVRRRSAGEE